MWRAEGKLTVSVEDASELLVALEEDKDSVYEVFAEGIANSIQGVEPENVAVFDVQIPTRRLLDDIEQSVRRLASAAIQVSYVIHLDNQDAATAGVTPDSIAAQMSATAATEIPRAFAASSLGSTFNFTLVVTSVQAQPPAQEVVEQKVNTTSTLTTTVTASLGISPLDASRGGTAAASVAVGVIGAVFIVLILLLAAKCLLGRKSKDQESPQLKAVEISQPKVLEPHHVVWHLDEVQDVPAMDVVDVDAELPTPVLPDGSAVEYYSRTHNIWLPGKLKVIMTPGTLVSEPDVTYQINVDIGDGKVQLRENVLPDSFRAPFAEGELVEVLSHSAQKWLSAIVESCQATPTLNGYTLILTKEAGQGHAGKVLQKVSANRVRRRFEEGSTVSRYVGPVDGFEAGLVSEVAEADLAADSGLSLTKPTPSNASVYSNLPLPAALASSAEPWDKDLEGAAGKPNDSPAGKILQWSMVKLNTISDDSMIRVPSYAIFPLAEV